jgi:hypothetical protein
MLVDLGNTWGTAHTTGRACRGIMGSGDFGSQVGGTDPADQPDAYGRPQYGNAPKYREVGPYGQPGPYVAPGRVGRKTNSLAIASLCCGIGQILVGILAGIPAIVLALWRSTRSGKLARTAAAWPSPA